MYIKTSENYRSDLKAAKLYVNMVETRITHRLKELCERFPNIYVGIDGYNCPTKKMLEHLNTSALVTIEIQLDLIKQIETKLSEKSNGQQLKLDIN